MSSADSTTSSARPSGSRGRLLSAICGVVIGLGCLLSVPRSAEAREVVHVVQKGQWLDMIAKRYHTTAGAIMKRNGMRGNDLEPGMKLVIVETDEHRKWREHVEKTTGKRVSERVHRKKATQKPEPKKPEPKKPEPKKPEPKKPEPTTPQPRTIKSAKQRVAPRAAAESKPETAAKPATEKRSPPATPAAEAPAPEVAAAAPPKKTYAKAPKRPGYVTLIRYGEKFRGQLVASNGKVVAKSSQRVDRLMRSLRTGKQAKINRRLLALLTKVSDHFGGRTIVIVSGFRPYSAKQYTRNSRHNHGKAVDFKVTGVPTDVVFELCRQFDDVGCGYYPNSGFVHMDVRGRNTQWTDYSRPGQPPKYARKRKATKAAPSAAKPTKAAGSAKRHVASKK